MKIETKREAKSETARLDNSSPYMATDQNKLRITTGNYNEDDVLLGRFKFCRENDGNKRLKRMIIERYEEYEQADLKTDYMDVGKKRDKKVIKEEIVAAVKANGGRFLRRRKDSGLWEEVSQVDAIARVTEEFKNLRSNQKREEAKRNENKRQKTSHPPPGDFADPTGNCVSGKQQCTICFQPKKSDLQEGCRAETDKDTLDAADAMLGLAGAMSRGGPSRTSNKSLSVTRSDEETNSRQSPESQHDNTDAPPAPSPSWIMPKSSPSRTKKYVQIDDFLNDLCISPSRVAQYKKTVFGMMGVAGRLH